VFRDILKFQLKYFFILLKFVNLFPVISPTINKFRSNYLNDSSLLVSPSLSTLFIQIAISLLTMKIILVFFSLLIAVTAKRTYWPELPHISVYYKNVKCQATEKTVREVIFPNFTCFAKSYARNISTFNMYVVARKPINKLFVSVDGHRDILG
jgi:hypothetical protein